MCVLRSVKEGAIEIGSDFYNMFAIIDIFLNGTKVDCVDLVSMHAEILRFDGPMLMIRLVKRFYIVYDLKCQKFYHL